MRRALGLATQQRIHLPLLAVLLLTANTALSAAEFVGRAACSGCHAEAVKDWQDSHHDLAMQPATADTVLGDFDNRTFNYAGISSRFYRDGDRFIVRTDNAEGELEDFEVQFVFGVYPLQQLLLALPGGRLQALTIAWDARPAAEGGQRWYHLFADEAIRAGDPLHWTGPYHNWNSRCAECHSTNVDNRYDAESNTYQTRYAEIDVSCEACHGPGSEHVALATTNRLTESRWAGLPVNLSAQHHWQRKAGEKIAALQSAVPENHQVTTCGRCHARRSTLGDYHYGADLLDTHRLATLDAGLYWPDGQIRDEVYVLGSFLQSAMHQAGVVCSDCHNPHSGKTLQQGNGLCTQCHAPASYDTVAHHHHPSASGSACVDCHMPATTYMGVDPRRDHSLRIPRPDVSIETGSPNACNQCHTGQSAEWALTAMTQWGIRLPERERRQARAFHSADRGDVRALPTLRSMVKNDTGSAIRKASASLRMGQLGAPDTVQTLAPLLQASEPLLRATAVRALPGLPASQRYLLLRPLITDPVLDVRMAVAEQLAAVPLSSLREQDRGGLTSLFEEYLMVQQRHLDMPSARLQLANFALDRGQPDVAEAHLRSALAINAELQPAVLNLADLLRSLGRETEARKVLQAGLAASPDAAALQHALGLLEIRNGERETGLRWLAAAAAATPANSRHRYVYAIALHDSGEPRQAIEVLTATNREFPGQPQLLNALIQYNEEVGAREIANRYREEARRVFAAAGGGR